MQPPPGGGVVRGVSLVTGSDTASFNEETGGGAVTEGVAALVLW